jgi:DNA transformation protein
MRRKIQRSDVSQMAKPPPKHQTLIADLDAKLAPLGHFRARPMFGGYGLYLDGAIFGLIGWDKVWFRVDDKSRPDYLKAGMEPFTYSRDRRAVTMAYFRCPDAILGDGAKLRKWAKEARRASVERKPAKKSNKSRRKRTPTGE